MAVSHTPSSMSPKLRWGKLKNLSFIVFYSPSLPPSLPLFRNSSISLHPLWAPNSLSSFFLNIFFIPSFSALLLFIFLLHFSPLIIHSYRPLWFLFTMHASLLIGPWDPSVEVLAIQASRDCHPIARHLRGGPGGTSNYSTPKSPGRLCSIHSLVHSFPHFHISTHAYAYACNCLPGYTSR